MPSSREPSETPVPRLCGSGPRYRDPRELRAEAMRLRATADAIEDGTWAFLCEDEGPRTPSALAERLGCSLQAANNRLRRLYDLALADRDRASLPGGGREFSYSVRVIGDA